MELFRGLRLPAMRRLLAPRSRAVAFLEAGAASCVASLAQRRREIIAAAVSAEQLLRLVADWDRRGPRAETGIPYGILDGALTAQGPTAKKRFRSTVWRFNFYVGWVG